MADKKISALTAATTPLAGTEVLPIVQSNTTTKVAVSDLTAGRSVSATSFVPTGSSVPANGMYLSAANTLALSTNTTLRATINSSGSIGIGTTSISNLLQVAGALGIDNAVFRASNTSGPFTITVGGLSTVDGNTVKRSSLWVFYSGCNTDGSNETSLLTLVRLVGVSVYDTIAVGANVVGTASISAANSTTTGVDVTFSVAAGNIGSVLAVVVGNGSRPTLSIAP